MGAPGAHWIMQERETIHQIRRKRLSPFRHGATYHQRLKRLACQTNPTVCILRAQIRLRRPHIMPLACLLTCLTSLCPVGAESNGEGAKGPRGQGRGRSPLPLSVTKRVALARAGEPGGHSGTPKPPEVTTMPSGLVPCRADSPNGTQGIGICGRRSVSVS